VKVFVTGATGFIGSAIVQELIGASQSGCWASLARRRQVACCYGCNRTSRFARNLESLRSRAAAADGVMHTAFIHDFSNYAPAAEKDRRAIENGHLSIC